MGKATLSADDAFARFRAYLREQRLKSTAQRDAIVLHHALGHSLEEIAQMEGTSRNTIKSRLRLGTTSLRRLVRRDQQIGVGSRGVQS